MSIETHEETAARLENVAVMLADDNERLREQWQPIETAPKDGGNILASKGGKTYITSWGACRKRSDGYTANEGKPHWRAYNRTHLAPTPTKWMPLPPAPEVTE